MSHLPLHFSALRRYVFVACCVAALSAASTLNPAGPAQASASPAALYPTPLPMGDTPQSASSTDEARVISSLPLRDPLDLPHAIIEGVDASDERAPAHWVSGVGLSVFSRALTEGAQNLQRPRPLTPIQWSIVASGGDYFAERLNTAPLAQAPASDAPGTDSQTWFVNIASGEVTPSQALITAEAEPALSRLLTLALTRFDDKDTSEPQSGSDSPTSRAHPAPAPPYDDLFFAPDGALIVTVPSRDRSSFTTVRISREASKGLLSPVGTRMLIGAAPTEDIDCSQARCVALTFDDGPDPQLTPQLLDMLFRERVHATFFVQGDAAVVHPGLVARALREGHTIGTHTWSHPRLPFLSAEDVRREVVATKDVVIAATGRTPVLMRPPYGEFSSRVLEVLRSTGDAVIMWNVDTEDWKNKNVPETTRRAIEGSKPGSIILMHDVHPTSVQSVPGIIRGLRERGYSLVSVPTLLGSVTAGDVYYGRE